jgi:hypothetical protein
MQLKLKVYNRRDCTQSLWILLLTIILMGLTSSCYPKRAQGEYDRVSKQADYFYKKYLVGDANQARTNLQSCVRLFEENPSLTSSEQVAGIRMGYMRLYALEARVGNSALSCAALIKMNYWNLRFEELQGKSAEGAIKDLEDFTTNRIIAAVDSGDRRNNAGKTAYYLTRINFQRSTNSKTN